MIYDSHCHLDLMDNNNMTSTIQSLEKENIGILSVGTTPRAYLKEVKMFNGIKNIHVALGLHPQLIGSGYDDLELFESLVQQCHYIGEVGLDFSKEYITNKNKQIEVFYRILLCCEKYGNKVVSIHSLKATTTVLKILNQLKRDNNNTYILHWFTGSIFQMQNAIDMGCFFSINPKMLKTKSGINLIQRIPPNKILLETDAPFSIKLQSTKQLRNILQNMTNTISMLKQINIKNQLIKNAKTIYIY
ncbi:Qat anti-phage system TatD family nuclease QatD [Megamonas hypermegale]|uniref:Qat anti-phage system TatD family nuclease QatD n=1 Tax=Megamonas hypermegale TaxID=158847 RepID=UPI00195A9EE8|nr:Qat anti-phage system TatD family nuclease QatD [Megamonas hypermegale]MBM6760420.1 TatD family hydrolase [Megamonas hypermegale]